MKLYIKKFFVILLIFLQIFQCHPIYAKEKITLDEARRAIASYAINFYNKHKDEVYYLRKDNFKWTRDMACVNKTKYKIGDSYTEDSNGVMYMDCVGWVNFCIYNSTGLDCGIKENIGGYQNFVGVNSPCCDSGYFEVINDEPIAGDILVEQGVHIMVYVGDGKIVDCSAGNYEKGLRYVDITKDKYNIVYRLTNKGLNNIDTLVTEGDLINFSSNSNPYQTANFYYDGISDGKYVVTKSILTRIIESISGIFDFLAGLITMAVRMVFVGWAAIVETLATATVKSITGSDKLESMSVTSTNIDSSDNITIEKIVFNQIGIFDVNFFNFSDIQKKETN